MKVLAIVSEFNPFHRGHEYLVQRAKKELDPDLTISLMSGDFVQRGEPALLNKWDRADLAKSGGCDLILEMPSFFSLQSGHFFAKNSLKLLGKVGATHLAFGIEGLSGEDFFEEVKRILRNKEKIDDISYEKISKGLSPTAATYQALEGFVSKNFLSSNNILALEYIMAIKEEGLNITPFPIERKNAKNSDVNLGKGGFASSTAIRENLDKNLEGFLPTYSREKVKGIKVPPTMDFYYDLFSYKVLIEKTPMKDILAYEEGMESLFEKNILRAENFDNFLKLSTSKRYSTSRIKRFILNYLLDNKKDLNNTEINFARVLAFDRKATDFFPRSDFSFVTNKKSSKNLDEKNMAIFKKMLDSSNLYQLASSKNFNLDYKKKIGL